MEIQIPFQIKNIKILDINLAFPSTSNPENKIFHYNINLQHRISAHDKLISVDISVEIINQDKTLKLGSLKATCIYFVESLSDFKSNAKGQLFDLPEAFVSTLNSISISTTRGIMFSQFRGTHLHNAILPIIDPSGFKQTK
jgi:hypothetical protein